VNFQFKSKVVLPGDNEYTEVEVYAYYEPECLGYGEHPDSPEDVYIASLAYNDSTFYMHELSEDREQVYFDAWDEVAAGKEREAVSHYERIRDYD
jgi:hypothetical protein